jgi:hypothetical protein
MTTNYGTPSDADRLQELRDREGERDLSAEELTEYKRLGHREAARMIIEGFYHIAGGDRATEEAFEDLWTAVTLIRSDIEGNHTIGYIIALSCLQRHPAALARAVRVLRDKLRASAPTLDHALRVFAKDMEADDGAA